jgi:hypothetical protein
MDKGCRQYNEKTKAVTNSLQAIPVSIYEKWQTFASVNTKREGLPGKYPAFAKWKGVIPEYIL